MQVALEEERFSYLVTPYKKLYRARGADCAGKRAIAEKRRTYLKIAPDVSRVLEQGIE